MPHLKPLETQLDLGLNQTPVCPKFSPGETLLCRAGLGMQAVNSG